jgi:hypothetical protein
VFDDLPRAEVVFVGVGTDEVEIELVGVGFGQEVATAGELLKVEELVFNQAVNRFDIALPGVSAGRDAHMLAVAEGGREAAARASGVVLAHELAAVVSLPDQVAQRDAVAKTSLAAALRRSA